MLLALLLALLWHRPGRGHVERKQCSRRSATGLLSLVHVDLCSSSPCAPGRSHPPLQKSPTQSHLLFLIFTHPSVQASSPLPPVHLLPSIFPKPQKNTTSTSSHNLSETLAPTPRCDLRSGQARRQRGRCSGPPGVGGALRPVCWFKCRSFILFQSSGQPPLHANRSSPTFVRT